MLNNYTEFLSALRIAGFSMGGGNPKGIYSVLEGAGEGSESQDFPIRWHSEDPEIDPWEWRMRVLEEETDIAYGKLFFKTSGYITKEWYPYFYAVRRGGASFDEVYETGTLSLMSKNIYNAITQAGRLPLHEIKLNCSIKKEDNAKFDRALTELQTKMFITMCGRMQKLNKYGLAYGWNSTVFCSVEDFWNQRDYVLPEVDKGKAYRVLEERALELNPAAELKFVKKFIMGI